MTCLTDQGTRYEIPVADAIYIARHGMPYNHYAQQQTGQMQQQASQPAMGSRPGFSGASMTSPQISGYGDIGIVNTPGP